MYEAGDTLTVIYHGLSVYQYKPLKDAKDRNVSYILY